MYVGSEGTREKAIFHKDQNDILKNERGCPLGETVWYDNTLYNVSR